MKKIIAYLSVSSLFYLQLASPFFSFNVYPTLISGVVQAQECDPAEAARMGITCDQVNGIRDAADADCADVQPQGEKTASEEELDQETQDATKEVTAQFLQVKQEESGLMFTSDIITGIIFLAIGVVAVMLGMTCVKGCGAGTYWALTGAIIYFIGEIIATIAYNIAMGDLGVNQENYAKCQKAHGVNTGNRTPEEIEERIDSLTSLESRNAIDSAQFGALQMQKDAFVSIRNFAYAKAALQAAATVAFFIALGLSDAEKVKDLLALETAASALTALNVANTTCINMGMATAAAANSEPAISCTACMGSANISLAAVEAWRVQYLSLFDNCAESPLRVTTETAELLTITSPGWAGCSGISPQSFAHVHINAADNALKTIIPTLEGHLFPNCTPAPGCAPAVCKIVNNNYNLFTPMSTEQRVTLESKNWLEKIMNFVMPSAEASAGGWIKGLTLTAMVLIVLLGVISGFTSLGDSFSTKPPTRVVLFGVMSALGIVATGITFAVAGEMQARIDKIDLVLGAWQKLSEDDPTTIEESSGDAEAPAPPTPTPPPAPTPTPAPPGPTPTPPPTPTVGPTPEDSEGNLNRGSDFRNYAVNLKGERSGFVEFFKGLAEKFFNGHLDKAEAAASAGNVFTMPGNKRLPCIGKEKGGKCVSYSDEAMEALNRIPNVPEILKQQAKRTLLLSKELNGAKSISKETMNLALTIGRDFAKTKATTDKMEKVVDKLEANAAISAQNANQKFIADYNALSAEDKQKVNPKTIEMMKKAAQFKPTTAKEKRIGLFNQMNQVVKKALNKLSASARSKLEKSSYFSMGVNAKKIEVQKENMAKKTKPIDGSFEAVDPVKKTAGVATQNNGKFKDDIDDWVVTVEDINKDQEVSIFQIISQRYRRVYKLTP